MSYRRPDPLATPWSLVAILCTMALILAAFAWASHPQTTEADLDRAVTFCRNLFTPEK